MTKRALKMTVSLVASLLAPISVNSQPTHPFEDCVLAHMQGVSSDAAALAIRESCLMVASSGISSQIVETINVIGEYIPKKKAIRVHLINTTNLTITSMTFEIRRLGAPTASNYEVSDFYFLPDPEPQQGGGIPGLPVGDPLVGHMIRSGATANFEFQIQETQGRLFPFFGEFGLRLIGARGF
jgi:hypothetical protein